MFNKRLPRLLSHHLSYVCALFLCAYRAQGTADPKGNRRPLAPLSCCRHRWSISLIFTSWVVCRLTVSCQNCLRPSRPLDKSRDHSHLDIGFAERPPLPPSVARPETRFNYGCSTDLLYCHSIDVLYGCLGRGKV